MPVSICRRALVLTASLSLAACNPMFPDSMYSRDVTARLTGPSETAVGHTVQLSVSLVYSDGTVWASASTVDAVTLSVSDSTIAYTAGGGIRVAFVTGIAPGEVTVTAMPTAATTGTGTRHPGTFTLRVLE